MDETKIEFFVEMSCALFGKKENTAFRDKKPFPSVKQEGGSIMVLGQEKSLSSVS